MYGQHAVAVMDDSSPSSVPVRFVCARRSVLVVSSQEDVWREQRVLTVKGHAASGAIDGAQSGDREVEW